MERNGPGGMKTESRSPMMKSGVATPKHASNNIMTVIAIAATKPASIPAESALVLVIYLGDYSLSKRLCQAPRGALGERSPRRTALQFSVRNSYQCRDDARTGD